MDKTAWTRRVAFMLSPEAADGRDNARSASHLMIPARIEGATRYLGKPANWVPEQDGECAHLAIRDEEQNGLPVMLSAWTPTPRDGRASASASANRARGAFYRLW